MTYLSGPKSFLVGLGHFRSLYLDPKSMQTNGLFTGVGPDCCFFGGGLGKYWQCKAPSGKKGHTRPYHVGSSLNSGPFFGSQKHSTGTRMLRTTHVFSGPLELWPGGGYRD